MTHSRLRLDSRVRSLLKAISWRCVGTLDTFVVSFIVLRLTGAADSGLAAAKVSTGIASVEVITKIMLYYFHERMWARIPLKLAPRHDREEEAPAVQPSA